MDRFLLLVLLAAPASASASYYEAASQEFECKAPEAAEEVVDELFDPNALPDILLIKTSQPASEAASDAEPGDGSSDADLAELDAWRAAATRFEARAYEFADEVSRIVRRKYDDELNELRGGYERLVGKADIEERLLREKAIEAHERFIKDHPNSVYTARRMFRLAELHFEESEERFAVENDKYDELTRLFDQGKIDYYPEPPTKDYRKSIALYKRIIRDHKDYPDLGAVYYTLGYTYSDETSRHLDPARAEETYLALLDNVPSSSYRAQAYFRLGDLYFEENRTGKALQYYGAILQEFKDRGVDEQVEGSEERLYELALYKLAWATYKIDDLEGAMDLFMELLDWAEEKEAATGNVADLKPESVRYLAISLADKATELGVTPIEYASAVLTRRGEQPWSFPVLVELAGILRDQARFEEAIEAYAYLQQVKPNHPRGPEFQNNIITLYSSLIVPDPAAAARSRVELTNRYGLSSQWFEVNKNDKNATAAATDYILQALQSVAYSYHEKAQTTEDPNDYLLASQKYVEYLERYPFAKDAYDLNFYLADTYFGVGAMKFQDDSGVWTTGYEKAIEQYAVLFGFPEESHQAEAIQGIMFSYNRLWTSGPGATLADTPEALENLRPPLGQTVQFSKLDFTDLEKNYIRSIRWVQREVPEDPQLPTLLYDVGRIYYYKNHLEPARRVFDEIIAAYPETDEGAYSASLTINSYLYTGELGKMRQATERFAAMTLGLDPEVQDTRNAAFAGLAKDSLFKEGETAFNQERFACSLLSFLDYYDKYAAEVTDEDPQNLDLAVYNVAQSYSKLGKAGDSNTWYEKLLADFPHSEQAPATFWRMASNFERVLELDKAVQYYQDLITYHPDHEDAMNALYNTAFLRVGLGQFTRAARTYETYHDSYEEQEDAKVMLFRAAEMWEAAEDRREAKRVYERWLDLYGADDADRWVETQYKLAGFLREEGKARQADAKLAAISESYGTVKDDLGGIGLKITAGLAFEPLLAEFREYEAFAFPSDVTKPEQLLAAVERKLQWNIEIKATMDQFVVDYPDFEWQTAALYYKALAYKRHGDSWVNSTNPFDFESEDPDQVDLAISYQDQLFTKAQPFFDTAAELFKYVVQFATEKKRHTPWVDEALKELNRTDPNTYPVPKPENSTVIESDALDLPEFVEEPPEIEATRLMDTVRQLASNGRRP